MSILGRYLSGIFIVHLLLILISAVSLLQLFDVMSNADGLLNDLGGGISVILHYTLLRLPILVTFLLPFTILIAALMTFSRLHRYSELVAIQALGIPFAKIMSMLLPSMLLISFLHFLINDQITPTATRTLAEWEASVQTKQPNDIAVWLRDRIDLISIGSIEEGGRRLEDIVIFKRDGDGNLVEQTTAKRAVFADDGWWLHQIDDLTIRPTTRKGAPSIDRERWDTALTPTLVNDLAAMPNALSIANLRRLLQQPEIGSRPIHVYETWLHKSFAVPLSSLFMVVLAVASVRGLQRQGRVVQNALIGFGGAFLYFVADGMLLALGEAGSVSPALAAWLPLAILAACAAGVLYWVTMPRGRRRDNGRRPRKIPISPSRNC